MPKEYVAVLADGSLLPCSERDLCSRTSEFARRVHPRSFMRIGRYTVAIGAETVELAVMRTYSDEDTADAIAGHGEYAVSAKYRDESNRDRRAQIAQVRRAFGLHPEHPMRGLVEHDAQLELEAMR